MQKKEVRGRNREASSLDRHRERKRENYKRVQKDFFKIKAQ